jgi:carbamoyltransferase
VSDDLDSALSRLGDRLHAVGFNADALRTYLGASSPDDVGFLNHAPALERLRGNTDPAAVLLRLFFLEGEETAAGVRRVFSRNDQHVLSRVRLLSIGRSGIRARLRLDCVGGLALFGDRRFQPPDRTALRLPRGDMVYPPGADSVLLAQVVGGMRGRRVLDLCTGTGVQGLAAAEHAEEVVGVDISPRAIALATINAQLNRVARFTARQGDLYQPVRGERFDLIIANPPFVPAPRRGPSYHSGGPRGERVLRRVVAGLRAHLASDGRAIAISHLALRDGEDVAGVVSPWVRDFRGRSLALVLESGTPVDLAAAQSLFALDDGFAAYAREVRTWVMYLRRHRIREIVLLLLVCHAGPAQPLEVRQAFQRVLPIPLSRTPAELVAEWLREGSGEGSG